jgi:hypothetical protein
MVISLFKLQNIREKQTLGTHNRKTDSQFRILYHNVRSCHRELGIYDMAKTNISSNRYLL